MNKVSKYFQEIAVVFLLFIGLCLMLYANKHKDNEWKSLETLLYPKENIIDGVAQGDRVYTLISRSERTDYAELLVVFELTSDQSWSRVYENDFTGLKPWKIELADIDGDGTQEILTAVRKTTHFDKEERNRLFIFTYEDKKLIKKWTGTGQLTDGDWKDFYAGDLLPIPGDELIFTCQSEDSWENLSIYYWFDFGFVGIAKSNSYKNIEKLTITGENHIQIAYDNNKTAELTVQDGKIIEAAPQE